MQRVILKVSMIQSFINDRFFEKNEENENKKYFDLLID